MRGKIVNHNKIKNVGFLFEILVRRITSDVLEGINESPALNILKKYFNVKKELGKELQLYQEIINAPVLNETRALQYLDMVVKERKKLNEQKLSTEKYELVKEIKKTYKLDEFLLCKVPAYKLHASIYKTFLTETKYGGDSILNIQDVASARFTLIEHLIGTNRKNKKNESTLLEDFRHQPEDERLLTYKFLVDRFNKKYQNINDKQKKLLREYTNAVDGTNTLLEYARKETAILKESIRRKSNHLTDRVTQIKVNEVVSQLNTIGTGKFIKDNELTAIMIAYQIDKELDDE